MQVTEPEEGHPSHWFVAGDVTVRAQESGEEHYVGGSTFAVRLGSGAPPSPQELFARIWPHLRADLSAQCTRIAGQTLSLPLDLSPDQLDSALGEAS